MNIINCVDLVLKNELLTCFVEVEPEFKNNCVITYELMQWNKPFDIVEESEKSSASWELSRGGLYYVCVTAQCGEIIHKVNSYEVEYIRKALQAEFNIFCQSNQDADICIPKLEYTGATYPYQDFCLLYGDSQLCKKQETIEALSKQLRTCFHEFSDMSFNKTHTCYLLSAQPVQAFQNSKIVFSGMARNNSKLIVGARDLLQDQTFSLTELTENIGDFTMLEQHSNHLSLHSDYFGLGKMYYYFENNLFVISNSYHLLLQTMKSLGVKLHLNADVAAAGFTHLVQMFQQSLFREMNIAGIEILPIDKFVSIDESGVHFLDSPICTVLNNILEYNEDEYNRLLLKAKDEIIDNIRIAIECEHYKYMLVDLTGGLDSRTVYAALTNLHDYTNKVRINVVYSPNGDFPVAMAINNIYKYQYNDCPWSIEKQPFSKRIGMGESFFLGTYFLHSGISGIGKTPNTLQIGGRAVEPCARPIVYSYADIDATNESMDDLLLNYTIKWKGNGTICVGGRSLMNLLEREWSKIPGRSALEKAELHFLYYRNGMHFSNRLCCDASPHVWNPGQSISLFTLKHMVFLKRRDKKLQFDIVRLLNPLLSEVPHASDQYNQDKQRLFGVISPALANLASWNTDDTAWTSAKSAKVINRISLDDESNNLVDIERQTYDDMVFKCAMQALKKISTYKNGLLKDTVGLYTYAWMKDKYHNGNSYCKIVLNKIFSLYYELTFLDET